MALFPLDDERVPAPGLLMTLSDDDFRDLLSDPPARVRPPERSLVMLRTCGICREYAPEGSYAAGKCLRCGEPLSAV